LGDSGYRSGVSEASSSPARPRDDHIVVERVRKIFADHEALADINMTIRRGHVAVIIGGSGAGKTTLLKILIGLDRPTSGAIYVDGQNIVPLSERQLNKVRQKFGMVFQYSALLDSMNVLDNVAFPLREHSKLNEKQIREKVMDKLHTLKLDGTEKKFPSHLSGGMRKRVALARALMLDPEVIMYDEPTSGLDPITARLVDELIVETRDRFGVTSIVISHDMAGALRISDEIYLLGRGSIIASGSPDELVQSDHQLVREFLESSGIAAADLVRARNAPSSVEYRR
jgi:phospholipid/cholesterol/gamma-HCH transport system ATP-binding protein